MDGRPVECAHSSFRKLDVSVPKPVLLLILDGWGHRVETEWNAIAQANLPNWRRLLAECPHTLIDTHGEHVGLPDDQMGNSEVGHMNIGAGRVVYQELTRIDQAIRDGSFGRNAALVSAFDAVKATGRTLHVFGLMSPGGVHAHESHVLAFLDAAAAAGVTSIAVHAFTDGRDTPPQSAAASLQRIDAQCRALPGARIATVIGRYYAMDRDNRWERVEPAYRAITEAQAEFHAGDAMAALDAAYARGETDEFVKPTVVGGGARCADGDAVVFLNFRADRARELTRAFVREDFDGFARPRAIALSAYVTLTEYAADLPVTAVAYLPQGMAKTLPEVISSHGLKQLRIAETEKYAHVTFFLNGGREDAFAGEDRILVPSPKVATYDLQPEMSCPELTAKLAAAIRSGRYDLIVCNIANPDMVGHTGIFAAAIEAAEAVDHALGEIRAAIDAVGGAMIVTADHGNLELMRDPATGEPHTQHTVGPVPMVLVGHAATLRHGALCDLAPTILQLLDLPQPVEMTGNSLIVGSA
ncbi:MAG TPA: 2,3-bisphosphoglycerate-independent phosphoglycerate mutase [Patescibacteria group bacterium]|nr:2,3-bisphosphoglycerate-independent phosphoglycerate mutase [Patescibacteria group bacterium]